MSESDPMRNPTIIAERGEISGPDWLEKIITRNRTIWGNKNESGFEDNLNIWSDEINLKLNKLRGDKNVHPKFSIIVPAHNEEEFILQLLESISNQKMNSGDGVEVLVVVNDSNDRTADLSRKCGARVIEYNQDKKYSPVAHARQRGLEMAEGEIILSTDADVVVGNRWIEEITKPILKNTDVLVSIGNISNYEGRLPVKFTNPINNLLRKYEVTLKPKKTYVGFANIALRKKDLEEIGGWPQKPVEEDSTLIRRIAKIGKLILADQEAMVWSSGRREMAVSLKESIKNSFSGGDHFIGSDGKLKIVR
jgi:cellulose synthase/poly-beta-1,6-N-acetylglucosamine synthase-like glycosyltransferase